MPEMVYAVHTRTCTYLLDDDGVCGWVLSPSGDQTQDRCIGAQFVACLDLREHGGLVGELRVGASGLFARQEGGRLVLLKTSVIEHVEFRRSADLSVTEFLPGGAGHDRPGSGSAPRRAPDPPPPRWAEPTDPERTQPPPLVYGRPPDPDRAEAPPVPYHQDPSRTAPPPPLHRTAPPPPAYYPAGGPPHPRADPSPQQYAAAASGAPGAFPPPPEIIDLEELSTFSSEVTLTIPLYRPEPDDPPPRSHEEVPRGWPAERGQRRR